MPKSRWIAVSALQAILLAHAGEPLAPQPGSEAALRRLLGEVASGKPNYDLLAPQMAAMMKEQLPQLHKDLLALGQVNTVTFANARMQGADIFDVKLANGALKCLILVGPDGKVALADCRQAGPPPQQQ